jgi:rare lipoprotein A
MLKLTFLSALAALAFLPGSVGASSSRQCSEASFYGHGDGFAWQTMANGQAMDPYAMIAAHPYLPFGTRLRVVNRDNGRAVTVRITDRGPYVGGRSLDLSIGAFRRIESPSKGWARVCFHEA